MTAKQLAKILNVSKITIFKQAKAGRIPRRARGRRSKNGR